MTTMKAIATGCMLLATSGCSSVMSHTGPNQGYYPGTRASVDMLKDDNTSWAMMPLVALDLPFSAVMDTVLLPYDAFQPQRPKMRRESDRYEAPPIPPLSPAESPEEPPTPAPQPS